MPDTPASAGTASEGSVATTQCDRSDRIDAPHGCIHDAAPICPKKRSTQERPMKTGFIPWTDVVFDQVQAHQRVAWFIVGCIEREHRLNLEALSRYWLGASTNWLIPLSLHRIGTSNSEGATEDAALP
jgi:hypothetical protein